MEKPVIHRNGTSASELAQQFCDCGTAVNDAIRALCANGPNQRDYYPKTGAWEAARKEHEARITALTKIRDEMQRLMDYCMDAETDAA